MSSQNNQLKQYLMSRIEQTVDKLLAARKPDDEISLSEIEALVQAAGSEIQEELLAGLVGVEQVEQPVCPSCGGRMQYKGHKPKHVITTVGEAVLERVYYYCPVCHKGFFPPG
jgi:tRNA(Ile2) C34 agmatinyltransferase TiaS